MEKDNFDIKLDNALSKVNRSEIDLLGNRPLLTIVKILLKNTDAGSYLNTALEGDFSRSFSDEAEEELEFDAEEFVSKQFNTIPIGKDLIIDYEFEDKIDINMHVGPYAKEPSYKTGYIQKSVYFKLYVINTYMSDGKVIIKYNYQIETKVSD